MVTPRRRIARLVFCVVSAVVAVGVSITLRVAVTNYRGELGDFARRPRSEIAQHPERTGIAGLTEVSIIGGGERLAGWYAPSRNRGAVLLIHGAQADRSSVVAETQILARAGFGVLALDLPGQGASDGRTFWGVPERRAISTAVGWLRGREDVDADRIGAFGHSMGAYVLTQAAVVDERLHALTLAACPTDIVEQNWVTSGSWGLLSRLPAYLALRVSGMPLDDLPKDLVGRISPRPVFLLGGELDATVPEYMVRQLFARAGHPKEIWIVAGAHHGDYAAVAPREYAARLEDFFRRTLLGRRDAKSGRLFPGYSIKVGVNSGADAAGSKRASES
jgi:dipeptidyl aminopeptidase/acylaminoacyl peptidase